jgi:hypothetical protein
MHGGRPNSSTLPGENGGASIFPSSSPFFNAPPCVAESALRTPHIRTRARDRGPSPPSTTCRDGHSPHQHPGAAAVAPLPRSGRRDSSAMGVPSGTRGVGRAWLTQFGKPASLTLRPRSRRLRIAAGGAQRNRAGLDSCALAVPRCGTTGFTPGIVRRTERRFRGAIADIHQAEIPCGDVRPGL